jgi:hypothetical protein
MNLIVFDLGFYGKTIEYRHIIVIAKRYKESNEISFGEKTIFVTDSFCFCFFMANIIPLNKGWNTAKQDTISCKIFCII